MKEVQNNRDYMMISNMKTSKLSQFYNVQNIDDDNSDAESESNSSGSENGNSKDAGADFAQNDAVKGNGDVDNINDSDSSNDLQDEAEEFVEDEECEEEESKVNKIDNEGKFNVVNQLW